MLNCIMTTPKNSWSERYPEKILLNGYFPGIENSISGPSWGSSSG